MVLGKIVIVIGSGPGAYGITAVVAGAIGYLYIRWKDWKLSDLMFVTKRGLSDACDVVGKQLEHVSENVNAAKRHLAGRIDHVDCTLDECQEITESTRKEVTVIHEDISAFQEEMQSVHLVVRTLETKLGRLAYTQDRTARGIYDLCEFTKRLDKSPKTDTRQASCFFASKFRTGVFWPSITCCAFSYNYVGIRTEYARCFEPSKFYERRIPGAIKWVIKFRGTNHWEECSKFKTVWRVWFFEEFCQLRYMALSWFYPKELD
uniref:DUF1664 domain-containing protein n=1 Tax=Oryza nivara TaxID=4536 RepID=A0A0E0FEX9_ORYNI